MSYQSFNCVVLPSRKCSINAHTIDAKFLFMFEKRSGFNEVTNWAPKKPKIDDTIFCICEFCNLTFYKEIGADNNMAKKWRNHMYSKHFKTKFHEEFGDLISSKICNLGNCETKSFSDTSRIIQHLYGKQHGIIEKFITDYWENEKMQKIADLTKNDAKNNEIIIDKIMNQNSSSEIMAEEFSERFSKIHREVVRINQDDVLVVPITIPILADKNIFDDEKSFANISKSNNEALKNCPQCPFYANNRAVLEMHLENFHRKICEFCQKSFNELKDLENHILLQHTRHPDQIQKYSQNLLQSVNLIWESAAKKNWGLTDVDLEYTDKDFQTLNTFVLFKQRYLPVVR